MNLQRVDLNLLVYLDILLSEKNVTKAAERLGITQPAMSNILRRLRKLFNDPLLVRSSEGMTPTDRAKELQPHVREILGDLSLLLEPRTEFRPYTASRKFSIMTSDYAEATLVPSLVKALRSEAPNVTLDFLTPSDVSYRDMEQGKVDLAINRFNDIPPNFHQVLVWRDTFSCLLAADSPYVHRLNLKSYLEAQHIWVSKANAKGFGIDEEKTGGIGSIDQALQRIGKKRRISIYTRHYQMPAMLATNKDLIATLPTRVAKLQANNNDKIILCEPPFFIPEFELTMAWSPLLQHQPAHRWLRQLIQHVARQIVNNEQK